MIFWANLKQLSIVSFDLKYPRKVFPRTERGINPPPPCYNQKNNKKYPRKVFPRREQGINPHCHNQKTTKKLLKNCFNGGSYEIFLERLKKQHKTLQNELFTLTSYQNWKDVNFRKKNTYHSILIYKKIPIIWLWFT